ncbi:hypothetical protein [Streptobacillus moniliformis]|uniref:hypothetical protein n=1 Tax=Streptobacillus moniliformis TaxID=34105 RepID=UPI0007E3ADFD|nr:hypothetical protein [Streptobacillus moniliformis]
MKKIFMILLFFTYFSFPFSISFTTEDKQIDEILKDGIYTREQIMELRKFKVPLEEIAKVSKIEKRERKNLVVCEKNKREEIKEIVPILLGIILMALSFGIFVILNHFAFLYL